MLETKENNVRIEGILNEINLAEGNFTRVDGTKCDSISGTIIIGVTQDINGVATDLSIPVHMFAAKYTNDGRPNPAYEGMQKVMKEYVSVAAAGIDAADRVRITHGQITMNEYYNQNGNLVSFPRISSSFVSKVKKEEFKPTAVFTAVFVVGRKVAETDKDGIETGKYKISGLLPQYGGKIDVVPFYAVNPGVIDAISQYWNEGDTVRASGKVNFTSRTEIRKVEVDFGEPTEESRTISVSELLITGGNSTPLDGDFAIDNDEVQKALTDRTARLEQLKNKKPATTKGSHTAPAKNKFNDLGF